MLWISQTGVAWAEADDPPRGASDAAQPGAKDDPAAFDAHQVEVQLSASALNARAYVDDSEEPIPLPTTLLRPPGPMRVRVVASGYAAYETTLEVEAGQPLVHVAELTRISSAERERLARQRTLGLTKTVLFWSGVSLTTVGLLLVLLPNPASPEQDTLYRRIAEARTQQEGEALYRELARNADTARTLQTIGWVGFGVGLAATATWAVMSWFRPGESQSSQASINVGVAPGGVAVGGRF